MPNKFKLLVFDWDGTLMDSAGLIVSSLQAACRDLNLAIPSDEKARHVIGLGLKDALDYLLPNLQPDDHDALVTRYRSNFLAADATLPLFEGAENAIKDLYNQGFLLAVATGKSRHGLNRALAQSGLTDFFHYTRCADEGHSKPHPGMLQEIMRELAVGAEVTLMIGDTSHDLQMASNAGVAAAAISHGAHPRENLLGFSPLVCAHDISELHRWLLQNA